MRHLAFDLKNVLSEGLGIWPVSFELAMWDATRRTVLLGEVRQEDIALCVHEERGAAVLGLRGPLQSHVVSGFDSRRDDKQKEHATADINS